eukprot:495236-Amphidinium_carterae.1
MALRTNRSIPIGTSFSDYVEDLMVVLESRRKQLWLANRPHNMALRTVLCAPKCLVLQGLNFSQGSQMPCFAMFWGSQGSQMPSLFCSVLGISRLPRPRPKCPMPIWKSDLGRRYSHALLHICKTTCVLPKVVETIA